MKKFFALLFLLVFVLPSFSWDGYDWDKNTYVEIEKGNLVRRGREIEVYDYSTGQYKHYEVDNIRSRTNHVDLDVYDSETGEYRQFEMDRY